MWAKNGIEFEIMFLLKNGETAAPIPTFLVTYGEKSWEWFLRELSKFSELPLEEIIR